MLWKERVHSKREEDKKNRRESILDFLRPENVLQKPTPVNNDTASADMKEETSQQSNTNKSKSSK